MQVQWLNIKSPSAKQSEQKNNKYNNNFRTRANCTQDIFVKSTNNISFKGKTENKVSKNSNVAENLALIALAGGTFSLALSLADIIAHEEDPSYIFSEDGSFVVDTDERSFTSSHIKADADDGIFKVEGSNVDIDPKRFDFIDVQKGIYQNSETGIDIDLLNNKYIDPVKGIFVDPENKISAFRVGDHFEHVAIPELSFGTSMDPVDHYSQTPETPVDDRTITMKIFDYFVGEPNEAIIVKGSDIFGREMLKTTDLDGAVHLTPIPDGKASEIFKDFIRVGQPMKEAADNTNQLSFSKYIEEHPFIFGTEVPFEGLTPDVEIATKADVLDTHLSYDQNAVSNVLESLSKDGSYYPNPGSTEAVEFMKYQGEMLNTHVFDEPLIDWHLLFNPENSAGQALADHLQIEGRHLNLEDEHHNGFMSLVSKALKHFDDLVN